MLVKKFDAAKSHELALAFLRQLKDERLSHLSTQQQKALRAIIDILSSQEKGLDFWKTTYQMTFGLPFSEKVWLSEEETFTTLIHACARSMFPWADYFLEFIDLLFFIRYPPIPSSDPNAPIIEDCPEERALWKNTAANLGQDLPRQEDSLLPQGPIPFYRFGFDINEYFILGFLDYKYILSLFEMDEINAYISEIGAVESPEKTYQEMTGDPDTIRSSLNEATAFTLTIETCAKHIYNWKYQIKGLLKFLLAMRYSFDNQHDQIKMWKERWSSIYEDFLQEKPYYSDFLRELLPKKNT